MNFDAVQILVNLTNHYHSHISTPSSLEKEDNKADRREEILLPKPT